MNPQGSHLLTVHGTTLWFDESTNTVRHALGHTVARNLTLENRPGHDVLVAKTPTATAAIDGLRPDGRLGRSPGGAPLTLQRRRLPDGLIALEANGQFLCGEADGTISLSREEQGPWEVFATLDQPDLDWLAYVAGHAWFSASTDGVVPGAAIRPVNGFGVRIGPTTVRLDEFLAARPQEEKPRRVTVHYDGWKIEELTLWRPLVYLVAFGSDDVFHCLTMTLHALRQFGQYEGEILLFTDRMPEQLNRVVPPGMETQIRLATSPARDVLDYTATKFRICDIPELVQHQPLLYLDADVICDRPIEPALRDIFRAGRLCLALEHDLMGNHNFYGANLFAADRTARPRHERGASSSIIGVPDMEVARRSFPTMLTSLYAVARTAGSRHPSDWYDQPVVNYVLHKTDAANFAVLTPRVVTPVDLTAPASAIARLGFAHFCGGVGNTAAKLPLMRAYLDLLRAAG